jgi:hypothetical protein
MFQLPPLLEKLDIKFDPEEAFDYYQELEKKYQEYKWTYGDFSPPVPPNSNYEKMFGWSLNSNTNIDNAPNRDFNGNHFRDTPCAFGFGKKVMNFFNDKNYVCVTVFPPDTHLGIHDDDCTYKRIHLPLSKHENFFFFDEYQNKFVTEPGNVYILHTERLHGASNSGTDFRSHLLVKYETRLMDRIYSKQGLKI